MTSPTGMGGRTGVALGAHAAMGIGGGSDGAQALPGMGINAKVTPDVVSVGPAVEVTGLLLDRTYMIEPFVAAAVTPVAIGRADGSFTTSVMSPRLTGGVYVPFGQLSGYGVTLRGPWAFTVSAFAEYEVRATGPKSEPFVGATAGIGYFFQAL